VERDEADLVEDEEIDAAVAPVQTAEAAFVARLEQRAHEVGGADEGNVLAPTRRLDAEPDRQVRFASADRPGEDDVVAALDPAAARQLDKELGIDTIGGRDVEVSQRLELGE